MSGTFLVGDEVKWTSQSAGYWKMKRGVVAAVVPPMRPTNVRLGLPPCFLGGRLDQYRLRFDVLGRDHETYLVVVPNESGRGKPALYCPIVKHLRHVRPVSEGAELFKPLPRDVTRVVVSLKPFRTAQRVVVCAAMKTEAVPRGGGKKRIVLVASPRHYDEVMRGQLAALSGDTVVGREQGFLDQWGNFMDRKEAAIVARASGQRLRNPNPEAELFSEDLY